MQLLQEMNPDVSSDYLDESVESILENNPEFFNAFKVVIASSLKEKTLTTLSRLLWSQNIPFVYCRSVGFIASVRLQYKEHFVVETHPDNIQSDLRLEEPFAELETYLDVSSFFWFPVALGFSNIKYIDCVNFCLQNVELSPKVPWIVIVHKFLKQWQANNGGKVPSNYKEKCELKKLIQAGSFLLAKFVLPTKIELTNHQFHFDP